MEQIQKSIVSRILNYWIYHQFNSLKLLKSEIFAIIKGIIKQIILGAIEIDKNLVVDTSTNGTYPDGVLISPPIHNTDEVLAIRALLPGIFIHMSGRFIECGNLYGVEEVERVLRWVTPGWVTPSIDIIRVVILKQPNYKVENPIHINTCYDLVSEV